MTKICTCTEKLGGATRKDHSDCQHCDMCVMDFSNLVDAASVMHRRLWNGSGKVTIVVSNFLWGLLVYYKCTDKKNKCEKWLLHGISHHQNYTWASDSYIFIVFAVVDPNSLIWAAEKRELSSSASNIVKKNSTSATGKDVAVSCSTCVMCVSRRQVQNNKMKLITKSEILTIIN